MAPTDADMDMDTEVVDHEVEFSSTATTIDPSVISSRIRQSASLQKEEQQLMVVDNNNSLAQEQQQQQQVQPHFPKLSAIHANQNRVEYRRIRCPPHRYTPLREHWENILTPLVEYLKLQVRTILDAHYDQIFVVGRKPWWYIVAKDERSQKLAEKIVLFLETQTHDIHGSRNL